jgi:serine/threonine protein kinase
MDPERWREIEELYHSALEKQASERASFLDERCAADPTLRQEVESLLAVADDADGYLKAAVHDATLRTPGLDVATADPVVAPAPRKLGRYELLEQVGKGGMGVVYRAVDPAIGRTVAIKMIRLDVAAEEKRPELQARLLRESQAGGQLSHPNIVAVYDVSEEGDIAYIVMEFVVGRTLEQALATESGVHSMDETLRIIQECASALDYAHSRGVVHRDIKPANIMLQAGGAVKVADFGIAKAAQFSSMTGSAVAMGSPHYMAPEQWKGEAVTGRADQYALAAVAYTLLTGRRLFESETIASLAAQALYQEPAAATSLNPALAPAIDSVFRKALSKNPAARFATCGEFAIAVRNACGQAPRAPETPPGRRPRKSGRLAVVLGLGILAVVSGGVWLYQRNSEAQLEIAYWTSIRDSKTGGPFDAYLKRYPHGQFASLAEAQLAAMKSEPPVSPPPVAQNPQVLVPVKPEKTDKSRPASAHNTTAKAKLTAVADPYAQANLLMKRGAYADAVPYFSQAIATKPDYRSYFGRAGAYQRLERLEQAIGDYTQAIRFNGAVAMPYHERAVCLARLGRDDRALTDYNRAIELAPEYPLSWNGRGVIYLRRKEFQKAISDFTEAIRLEPTRDQPYKNRAAARKAVGDTTGADADLNHARELKQQ